MNKDQFRLISQDELYDSAARRNMLAVQYSPFINITKTTIVEASVEAVAFQYLKTFTRLCLYAACKALDGVVHSLMLRFKRL